MIFDNTPKKLVLSDDEVLQAIAEMHINAEIPGRKVYFNSGKLYAGEADGLEDGFQGLVTMYGALNEEIMKSYVDIYNFLTFALSPLKFNSPSYLKTKNYLSKTLKEAYINKIYANSPHLLMKTTLLMSVCILC